MKILSTVQQWRQERAEIANASLGFVPTMGALHRGHLELIRKAKEENERALVSIFVNPTQFNDPKDLLNYPRPIEQDIQMLVEEDVDYLFLPQKESLYPDNYRFKVSESIESLLMEGAHRPGHFDGVLTVVLRLLLIAQAQRAYFGQKDFQQLKLIREMVQAFFLPVEIREVETVRDQEGLALSSRNQLLSSHARNLAPRLYQTLSSNDSIEVKKSRLQDLGFELDYLESHWNRLLVAARIENVRLIDNVPI